jgi:Protein-tyrosine phosphatase
MFLFSAGIGRAGTFIVIDMILNQIKKHGKIIFVVSLLHFYIFDLQFSPASILPISITNKVSQ